MGTVEGCSGYSGGVQWVQWRGTVRTVERYGGRVQWVQWRDTVSTVEEYSGLHWGLGRVQRESTHNAHKDAQDV